MGIILLFSATWAAASSLSPPHLPLEALLVSNQGRVKPLATLAREQEVFLGVTFPGNPVDGFVALAFDPETWSDRVLLHVDPELGRVIGGMNRDSISLAQLVKKEEALERIASSSDNPSAENAGELLALVRRLRAVEHMVTVSPGRDSEQDWVSPNLHGAPAWARESWNTIKKLYRDGVLEEASHEAKALVAEQRRQVGDALPSRFRVTTELLWRRVNPPRLLPWLAGCALLLHLLGTRRRGGPVRFNILGTAFMTFAQAVFLCAWIIMAGRLPLLNSWEVHFLVLLLVPLIGLLVELTTGMALIGIVAVSLTFVGAAGLNFLPEVGSIIRPPVAILQSPWREVHILSIMTSYALLFLVTGVSTVLLWKPDDQQSSRLAYRALLFGELLLGVGIATGAAWAYEAWGRYWGWDPKEVWALVAWLVFAVGLHARASGIVRVRGWAALNLLGFAALLFTFFGVTYLLPGLHSYG